MSISNADLTCVAFLDALDSGMGIPDGCDPEALLRDGLVQQQDAGLSLTTKGRVRLANLRSVVSWDWVDGEDRVAAPSVAPTNQDTAGASGRATAGNAT